jgi:hypothetical protein
MAEDSAVTLRKVVGKFVLLFAGVWLAMLFAVAVAAVNGGGPKIPLINWGTLLLPGCALVPGAFVSLRLLRAPDIDRIKELWVKSALFGVAGFVVGVGSVIALVQVQKGG